MTAIDKDKYKNKMCDKILHMLIKCNTTENIKLKEKCIIVEKIINSSWIELYLDCKKN